MTNTYSVMSGMSTEKYQKAQLAGNRTRAGVSNIVTGSFLRFTMRVTTPKTLIWLSIILIVGMIIFRASSFLSRTRLQESTIPPLLVEPGDRQTEHHESGCDPILIAMDDDGNVYSGQDLIGSTAHPLNLALKLKAEIEVRTSRLAFTRGMDLNRELPSRCINVPVYIKADTHETRAVELIRALRDAGINPTRLVTAKARTLESPPDR